MGALPINVIPYGVDTGKFKPRGRELSRELLDVPPNAKVLLFVAAYGYDKYKGLHLLLEAVERLKDVPNLFLLVLGHGSLGEIPIPSKSLGYISDERILSLAYSAADLFVLPTLQDNFPNTALEALACGLPVAGFDVGGVPDIVRDGSTGLLAELGNSEALTESIKKLLSDSDRRERMSANCRRIAVQEYALEIQARRYLELYASLLRERFQPAASQMNNFSVVERQ
jgi:glycosyltransferase involved in cell wall biosynthesis